MFSTFTWTGCRYPAHSEQSEEEKRRRAADQAAGLQAGAGRRAEFVRVGVVELDALLHQLVHVRGLHLLVALRAVPALRVRQRAGEAAGGQRAGEARSPDEVRKRARS